MNAERVHDLVRPWSWILFAALDNPGVHIRLEITALDWISACFPIIPVPGATVCVPRLSEAKAVRASRGRLFARDHAINCQRLLRTSEPDDSEMAVRRWFRTNSPYLGEFGQGWRPSDS